MADPRESMERIPIIVEQHAEQGAFLWLLRQAVLARATADLDSLRRLDERIEAHREGLRLAGDAGWRTCAAELRDGGPGELFIAAAVALGDGADTDAERLATVLDAGARDRARARALISALGWIEREAAVPHLRRLLADERPALRRIGVAGAAAQRWDPGDALSERLTDADASVRARALRAVGELGRADLLPAVRVGLDADEPACRLWAAWTVALRAGDAPALAELRRAVESADPRSESWLALLVWRLDPAEAAEWLAGMAADPRRARAAVVGAGALGDPGLVPWLIERIDQPALARAAGQAIAAITGLDIEAAGLAGSPPPGFAPLPNDDPDDPRVELDPDEPLAWPDRDAVRRWWQGSRARFADGDRLLLGRPPTDGWLRELLRAGRQPQRAAAALALTIRHGGPLFEVRAAEWVR